MEQKNFDEWIDLSGIETSRTYHFPDGSSYTVNEPDKLYIKDSGSHKLTDKAGKMHYIRSHWITFSADGEWAFNVG